MVVEECAGSTPSHSNINGNIAPKHTLLNTIIAKADVTATASGNGVLKKIALQNPATLKIVDNATAILNSRDINCPLVLSFNVPNAKPRITT